MTGMKPRICGVVPAAGRGSRLGGDTPKVFIPILPSLTIWDVIGAKLSQVTDRIVLVLSPEGREFLATHRDHLNEKHFACTQIEIQERPLGMGNAIFGAAQAWRDFDSILVVWGDQFNLSLETLQACVKLHAAQRAPALTLPVVRMAQPYVEYVFDTAERLVAVRQSREGDDCRPGGFSDVGVFLLSGGNALSEEWDRYQSNRKDGSVTGEINFLPFLVHLSSVAEWPVTRYETREAAEAIGLNTPEDLAFARTVLQRKIDQPGERP
jgi:bifunctional UDP-N-acetylglucosamine pyrophosphorylase/glucosamine-1-phosphate N-acetyltransferase